MPKKYAVELYENTGGKWEKLFISTLASLVSDSNGNDLQQHVSNSAAHVTTQYVDEKLNDAINALAVNPTAVEAIISALKNDAGFASAVAELIEYKLNKLDGEYIMGFIRQELSNFEFDDGDLDG